MTTSSKMRRMPWRRVISRRPWRKPGWGGMRRWNGSMITAASSSACASTMPSTVARSLYGAISTSASMAWRNARGVRHRRGERLGGARGGAHHRVVVGAVVAALELEDLVALAGGARRAQGEEGRLGAGGGEAHLLRARHGPADLLGEFDDGLRHHEVRAAGLDLLAHRGDDGGMGVAEDERPGGEHVVDVFAARSRRRSSSPSRA